MDIVVKVDADLEDLIPGYLENRSKDINKIVNCMQAGDYDTIRRLAHRMKGSGGGYGFDGITDIGAAMEQAALARDANGIEEQVRILQDYLTGVEVVYV